MNEQVTLHSQITEWGNLMYNSFFSGNVLIVLVVFGILAVYDILRIGFLKAFTRRMMTGSLASIGILIGNILFVPFVYFSVSWLQSAYDMIGIPHLPETLWVGVPFWVAAILAILLHDFADYWNHRAMHTQWIWPIHAIHHSDEEVNALTTFRVHFLEAIFMKGSYILIMSWAGFPPEVAGFGAVLLMMHNAYVHANLDWDHGPFKLLLASPRFHRWHHANEPAAFGKNLANLVPAYDYMFGTYYDPGYAAKDMGADGVPHSDVVALMAYPFKEWAKAIAKIGRKPKPDAEHQGSIEPAE